MAPCSRLARERTSPVRQPIKRGFGVCRPAASGGHRSDGRLTVSAGGEGYPQVGRAEQQHALGQTWTAALRPRRDGCGMFSDPNPHILFAESPPAALRECTDSARRPGSGPKFAPRFFKSGTIHSRGRCAPRSQDPSPQFDRGSPGRTWGTTGSWIRLFSGRRPPRSTSAPLACGWR